MKKPSILTNIQQLFITLFSEQKLLSSKFYLTGGTAIAAYYIPYRYSQDLDFFSEKEIDTAEIAVFLRSVKNKLGYYSFDLNSSYNRNMFFLHFKNYVLKTEFTYFPFPQIEKPITPHGLSIDSIIDIAVNKLFTIYQKPRSRDFMDLYMIHKHYNYSMADLLKKAKVKFDWHIDKLKLGSQFLLSEELKDYPRLVKLLDEKTWQTYFKEEAKRLGKSIISI